ncbi:TPA: bacteriocin [Vibrio vulnificus]|nr:bacteriocin [Vibrio vulnificus]EGQ9330537.1 bacteriocin [Vibrio vulnificus]EHZ7356118.1 bacteriocin [Vibrio vulnificus]EHZ7360395.1 bacteriocin [Vibrio vulnificus]HAS6249975.1 bacteriocin [Vibrio vulnificus]
MHPTRPEQYVGRKAIHQAVSGTYLVDMDGLLSLNEIQRLPGKKLVISFNGSTIQVDELDVKVVGRVAVVMERV